MNISVRRRSREYRLAVADANTREFGANVLHSGRHPEQRKQKLQLHLPVGLQFLGAAAGNGEDKASDVAQAFDEIDFVGKNFGSIRIDERNSDWHQLAHDYSPRVRANAERELYAMKTRAAHFCGAEA